MTDRPLRIVLGADHRGSTQTERLREHLERAGHQASIIAPCDGPCDYPDQAYLVGQAIRTGEADFGVLICGTSIGMSIAANKIDGVRAAVVHDELTAGLSRAHNDANVLCLSGDLLGQHLIERIADAWLASPFEGGRHERRTKKIAAIERGEDPRNLN